MKGATRYRVFIVCFVALYPLGSNLYHTYAMCVLLHSVASLILQPQPGASHLLGPLHSIWGGRIVLFYTIRVQLITWL